MDNPITGTAPDLTSTETPPPTSKVPRILSLDVLRGIAILGSLLISIWIFGGFSRNMQGKLWVHPSGGNYRLFAWMVLLFEGKMRALISIVFGAGMVIFLAGENKISKLTIYDAFITRQFGLMILGLINALLFLATDEFLFHLGMMGILTFTFARLHPKGLFMAAIVTTLIFCGKNFWRYADDKGLYHKYQSVMVVEKKFKADSATVKAKYKPVAAGVGVAMAKTDSLTLKNDTLNSEQKNDKEAWEGLVKNMKYDSAKDAGENKSMRAHNYGDIWNHLLQQTQWKEAKWMYVTGIWDFASMIFLGMALFKIGFFTGSFSQKKYLVTALICLTVGYLLGWFRIYFTNAALLNYENYIVHKPVPYNIFFPFERGFVATGYAALVLLLLPVNLFKGIFYALACTGRMALTNYLIQSIFLTLFFTGVGMGYFGRLEQYQLYFLVAEVWLVQIVCSIFWMRHFSYGPAEWLLRCFTYRKWLPVSINRSATAPIISSTL